MISVLDISCRASLYFVQSVDVTLFVGVPNCAGVFNSWPYQCFIGKFLDRSGGDVKVATNKVKSSIGFLTYVVDVFAPVESFIDGNTQVLCGFNMFECVSMKVVIVMDDIFLGFSCYFEYLAFIWMEFHEPFFLPNC